MSQLNVQLQQLIDKTSDWDKDERYMATNDLCNILSRDIKLDEYIEQKICAAVLKQLDDQSNDVQSVAVKCLAVLVKKVNQNQINEIAKKLCALVVDGKDALRDIYSIGLKTLIADVREEMGPNVCDRLTAKLISGIGRAQTEEIKRECLDIMTDLLKKFGYCNENEHFNIMSVTFEQLRHDKAVIRKRATLCLGALAVVSSDTLLNDMINLLLERINEVEKTSKKGSVSSEARTLIQTIGAISRTVGFRLGKHLNRIIPLFLTFCGDPNDESTQNDTYNELRESCFPGLESFILRCPKEVITFIPQIIQVSLDFMKYDPNYAYDEEEDNNMDIDDEDNDYEEEDFVASDDDDSSWKVRKAAIRVIQAVIVAHPQLLKELYHQCADELIKRFKEREENVRLDIIGCFTKLVEASGLSQNANNSTSGHMKGSRPTLMRQNSTSDLLESRLDAIVHASCVQLNSQSIKTKGAVLSCLKEIISTLHGGLDKYFARLAGIAEKTLVDKNQSLKLESLQFLRLGITYHSPEVVQPSIAKLLPLVTKIISEDWYKSIAEALRVLAAMVLTMRPWNATTNSFDNSFNYQQFLGPIYQAILRRSEAMDIDFEIKECAITSLGVLFRQCGDHLNNDLSRVLELFHKRLDNETTRAITLKAISSIATSPLQGSLDLSAFLMVSGEELASYLRQYSRSLKQQTLQTIDALVCHPTTILNDTITTSLVKETSTLISDNDLHLAHLSLQLVISILKKNAAIAAESIANFAYEKAITLARSSLTQGQALDSLIAFFQAVLSTGHPRFHYSNIFIDLYQIPSDVSTATASAAAGSGSSFGRQGLSNLSKCIAGISSHLPTHELAETIRRIANDVDSNNDALAQLALLSIGEAGEHANLSAMTDLKDLLLKCFDRQSEDVKYAAAYALGHISVGSMGSFLPLVLQSIRATSSSAATTATRQKYLLFISLKEIIVIHANHITSLDFTSYLQDVLTLLLDELQSEEESLRNVIGDCLGVLTTILPKALIPTLVQLYNQEMVPTTESSKLALRTISHALRTALTRPLSTEASFEITSVMEQFLQLLRHIDLDVKKGGLLVVNTAVHHNPQTIHQHILTVIHPILIETLQIKLERVVDLGPFKHKIDDNLLLRKLSLTCLDTIILTTPDRFDANALMSIAPLLLADHEDVKALFLQLLPKICELNAGSIVIKVDEMIPLFEKMIEKASKDSAADKGGRELLKIVVKASLAMNKIEDVRSISRKWCEFIEKLRKSPITLDLFASLENETIDA